MDSTAPGHRDFSQFFVDPHAEIATIDVRAGQRATAMNDIED